MLYPYLILMQIISKLSSQRQAIWSTEERLDLAGHLKWMDKGIGKIAID